MAILLNLKSKSNQCNQSGWFDHVTNASLPTIRLLFVIWINARFVLQIIEA